MLCFAQSADNSAIIERRNQSFLEMVPAIRRTAGAAFRQVKPEAREELITEVVANAFVAFARLARCGREAIAYPTPLAQYAIRRIRDGRHVGTRASKDDVLSRYAQRRTGATVERLDVHNGDRAEWREVIVEDRSAGPAETAAARLDIEAWLMALSHRRRRAAVHLARGETTGAIARKFRVSPARISQIRHELRANWQRFHGEAV